MKDTFLTLTAESQGTYKEKGSKFLSFAYPIGSLDEIKAILEEKKNHFYDARHICYAYRLGHKDEVCRFNDDGEPSGTAGKPIYGQILSAEITNVLVVVVRYFGGTKLGVSGLIQAYREAARSAIEEGAIIERIVSKSLKLVFKYAQLNDVMRIIKEENLSPENQDFQLNCRLDVAIRLTDYDRVKARLLSIYEVEELIYD